MNARRVAAIYDVHGNLPALDAVLHEIEREDVDLVVVGGDLAWGPMPHETVRRLRELEQEDVFIRGNADREVAGRFGVAEGLDDITAAINVWCADQMTEEDRTWLGELPREARIDLNRLGHVLFCHGSPRSDEEIVTVATPRDRLRAALRRADADVVVCGHTHMQFDLTSGDERVVNAGSVGLPYEGSPGAYWALLADDVELRRTPYDLAVTIERFRASGCPHVEEAFVEPLVDPPAPDEVARHFETLEAMKHR